MSPKIKNRDHQKVRLGLKIDAFYQEKLPDLEVEIFKSCLIKKVSRNQDSSELGKI